MISDFHCGMNTDFLVLGFCTVCKVNLLKTFRKTAVGPIFNGHQPEHKCAADWDAALYRGSSLHQLRGRPTAKHNLATSNPTIKKKQIHTQAQLMLNHTPLPHHTTPFRQLILQFPPQLHCISQPLVGPVALLTTFTSPLLPTAHSAHTHFTPIQGSIPIRCTFTLWLMTIEDLTHSGFPKRLQQIYLTHCAKPQNQKINL